MNRLDESLLLPENVSLYQFEEDVVKRHLDWRPFFLSKSEASC